ncbi:MAG: hypothetical protein RLZZ126_827, partial [Pseudomonadota bacterium]
YTVGTGNPTANYTPNAGASGTDTWTYTASGPAGTTSVRTATVTIASPSFPVVTGPTFLAVAAGAAVNSQITATSTTAIVSYNAAVLPAGLSVNTGTGAITGTPTVPGNYSVTLTVTNADGPGTLLATINVGVPAPMACAMIVPLNTATRMDLKPCMFPTTAPTGLSVVATPSKGTVTTSGTTVTYTPNNNVFGTDSFNVVGYFAGGGVTAAGTVSVTLPDRPDPTRDATVTGIVGAQSDTSRRFATTQTQNIFRRAEALHANPPANGSPGGSVTRWQASRPGSAFAAAAPPIAPAVSLTAAEVMATVSPVAISKAQALDTVASGTGLKSLPFAESVASLLTTNSINLANLVPGSGAPKGDQASVWVEGVLSFGNRDANGATGPVEFSSHGVTVGVDRRFNDKLIMGLGFGVGRDKTIIGTDGSQNDGTGLSLAVYGSYQPRPGTFIDGMLGVGSIEFDTRRYVSAVNAFALGKRKGYQLFGSLSAGYEFASDGMLFSPYARLDYASDALQDAVETGSGVYDLAYFGQTSSSLQGTLGARAESIHLTSFGWAIPRVRAEYRHEFQSDRLGLFSYADQIGGARYALNVPGSGRDALVLGLGTDLVMRDGWTLGLDYQLMHTFGPESSFALRFKLTKDLDAKGLPRLVAHYEDNPKRPKDIQVEASMVADDNVTRAKAGPDVRSDTSYTVNVSKLETVPLSDNSRLQWVATAGGERFQNFNGLSRISAGLEAEAQYRESAEFDAPTWAVFGKASVERFQSGLRSGYRASLGTSVRQSVTDRITLFGALSRNFRVTSSDVFTQQENALRLNADYMLSDRATLYATGEFRLGDAVSTGLPSLENISIAKVFRQDDAYPGGSFFSYKFEARTVLATLGFNYAFGPRDSLDFSWRRVTTTPTLRPAFVTSPESYITNQWALTYLVRF